MALLHGFLARFEQRDLHVHESHGLVSQGHEIFAPHQRQQFQHFQVEHVPGADLLLDHVETGSFEIDVGRHGVFFGGGNQFKSSILEAGTASALPPPAEVRGRRRSQLARSSR